jgi:hypothetical protein
MTGLSANLAQHLLPAVLTIFLGLYGLGLTSGVDAEIALLRAGAAAVALAVLGRFAGWVLDAVPPPAAPKPDQDTLGTRLDVSIDDEAEAPAEPGLTAGGAEQPAPLEGVI